MCPHMPTLTPFQILQASPESNLDSDRVGVEVGLLESNC